MVSAPCPVWGPRDQGWGGAGGLGGLRVLVSRPGGRGWRTGSHAQGTCWLFPRGPRRQGAPGACRARGLSFLFPGQGLPWGLRFPASSPAFTLPQAGGCVASDESLPLSGLGCRSPYDGLSTRVSLCGSAWGPPAVREGGSSSMGLKASPFQTLTLQRLGGPGNLHFKWVAGSRRVLCGQQLWGGQPCPLSRQGPCTFSIGRPCPPPDAPAGNLLPARLPPPGGWGR